MLYTKTELAHLLRVSVKTVDRAVENGDIKVCVIGNARRFAQEEVDRFIGSRTAEKQEKTAAAENKLIPKDVLKTLESEMRGISHGTVSLTIHLRDYKPRFVIGRERSFLQEDGAHSYGNQGL
ncbi:MAG: helix-turn-helix domain-containing protein [Treponema sp.]|nr:helix-turn-helix domain-containing protein [Treponema sp.]